MNRVSSGVLSEGIRELYRDEVITAICEHELKELSTEMRQDFILCWWDIDEEDPEFSRLPTSLQTEMMTSEEAPQDCSDSRYNPLLLEALKNNYFGVTNEYLSERLARITKQVVKVNGEAEQLLDCPCCQYQTLQTRSMYDICPVCNWEDDGTNNIDEYSSPNHMTLAEGKNYFMKFGSVDKRKEISTLSDMKKRYCYKGL